MLLLALACSTPEPVAPPDPCRLLSASTPGPRAEARAATTDPLAIARLHIEEARLTGDPGFYTLAESAARCAASKADSAETKRILVHLDIQFHEFARAEALARELSLSPAGNWTDHMFLGDALMEQGRLDAAADAYQRAADLRPGLPVYDRIGWLRWLWGDLDGAVEMQQMAVSAGSGRDPETYAWVLTRLGWLHALRNEPSPEIDQALQLLPDYPPARFARGRIRLHAGDPAAADDLRAPTVESVRALADTGAAVTPESVKAQDPRGYAMWLSDRDPKAAVGILDRELVVRQDAVTQIAHAYAVFRAGGDGTAEARAALATGLPEPRSLLQAGLILGDRSLVERALSMGPGLLPSERALAK